MPYRVGKYLEWDAGHRVVGHEGKCRHLHGHRYKALIVCEAPVLDKISTVVDFGIIKKLIGNWIDLNWDHNVLFNSEDPILKFLRIADMQAGRYQIVGEKPKDRDLISQEVFQNKTPYIFQKKNPTAEVIAEELYNVARKLLETDVFKVRVWKVRVWETPTCFADWFLTNNKSS
jgi:6-pyruvoyl-tetrahydropterin synthase